GAVLLANVQGISVNVDPIFYTWLLHQPQKRSSRHSHQQPAGAIPVTLPVTKRKEDELSVGSAPLAKQPSNQASEYASSPVKTKTLIGDAFPWTISLSRFSVYTLLGQQKSFSLVEPMSCTSALAITSHKLQALGLESRHSFVSMWTWNHSR
ncbi:Vacuolar protein sorting-associated protein 13B, partial [Acipenser ruthenus]